MFKRRAAGYTIVETMIFLAVSGVIFAAAILLFQGQQGKTQFDQSMRDLNSKIEQYVNDVNSGFFPGSNQYSCTAAAGSRPVLSGSSPGGLGTNTNCIFLGKAIGVTTGGSTLTVYTVLGDRLDQFGNPVTSIAGAYTEPANQAGTDLTETYTILWGATVNWSKITDTSNNPQVDSNLVGFYNDPGVSSNGGSQSLAAYGYGTTSLGSAKTYIENTGQSGGGSYQLQNWQLCMQSSSSNRTALLSINVSSLGITTKLTFGGC